MKLIAGNSNKKLSSKISDLLGIPLAKANIGKFADQEINVDIQESIRGEDTFIIQSTSSPVNDNLMELLVTIDALKRGSARRITAVMPYFGYARQDRKNSPRSPISAKLVANLITKAGADRVLALDLHAAQIQGFFDIPVDNLFANILFIEEIKKIMPNPGEIVLVSPDVGGVVRARSVAKWLGCDIAIIDKRRPRAGVSEVMNIVGEISNKQCILIDDIADSAGTLCNAANALMSRGAKNVKAVVTHGIFSGEALAKIEASGISEFITTDTIDPTPKILESKKIRYITASNLIAESITRIHKESSLSSLFLSN